jgi:hypothetical protein
VRAEQSSRAPLSFDVGFSQHYAEGSISPLCKWTPVSGICHLRISSAFGRSFRWQPTILNHGILQICLGHDQVRFCGRELETRDRSHQEESRSCSSGRSQFFFLGGRRVDGRAGIQVAAVCPDSRAAEADVTVSGASKGPSSCLKTSWRGWPVRLGIANCWWGNGTRQLHMFDSSVSSQGISSGTTAFLISPSFILALFHQKTNLLPRSRRCLHQIATTTRFPDAPSSRSPS